jgi:hypothetical protein
MQKNQLQNVLNVAQESHSLAVVANFIRYQIGRAGVGPDWRHNDFGLSVVAQIEEPDGVIAQQAQKVAAALGERLEALPEDVARAIRYELMRYYLGYLQRAYVYGNSGVAGAWEHLREGRAGCSTP